MVDSLTHDLVIVDKQLIMDIKRLTPDSYIGKAVELTEAGLKLIQK